MKKVENLIVIIKNEDAHDLDYQNKYDIIIAGLILHIIPNSNKLFEKIFNSL